MADTTDTTASRTSILEWGNATDLQDFQYNGIDYLYNLEPQQNNLFMLDKFYDPYEQTGTGGYDIADGQKPSKMEYRIKKVSGFKLPQLEIKDDFTTSAFRWDFVSTGRSGKNEVTIDWVEDAFWTVKRYHMNWMNHWYDKYLDCMVVGQRGKFRNLVLYMYHYINLNKDTAVPIQKAVPIARFEFKGLIPQSIGDASFEWGAPGNDSFTTVKYVYNYLEIYFYPYQQTEKEFIGGIADFVQSAASYENTSMSQTWNTGIVGYTTTLKGMNPNGLFGGVEDKNHHSVYYI